MKRLDEEQNPVTVQKEWEEVSITNWVIDLPAQRGDP